MQGVVLLCHMIVMCNAQYTTVLTLVSCLLLTVAINNDLSVNVVGRGGVLNDTIKSAASIKKKKETGKEK